MPRVNISALNENDKILTTLLVNQMNPGVTNNGAPYVSFVLQDKTGIIDAKLWDAKEELLEGIKVGSVIQVNGEVLRYKNNLQLRCYTVTLVDPAQTDPADYVASTDLSEAFMRARISEAVASITDPVIRQITDKVLLTYDDKLYTYPAAAPQSSRFCRWIGNPHDRHDRFGQCLVWLIPAIESGSDSQRDPLA
jgi:3'-5' exoribonuclease